MLKLTHLLAFTSLVLIFSSCNQDSQQLQSSDDDIIIKKYVEIYQMQGTYLDDGIFKSVIKNGSAKQYPLKRQGVLVNYTLSLPNKTIVKQDSNIVLQHNIGLNFAGFEEALSTMAIGEKSQFFIPSTLAFGNKTASFNGYTIVPNSIVLLEIELRDIFPESSIIDYYLKLNNISAVKTASGLYYKITSLGTTNKSPLLNNNVTVNYNSYYINRSIISSNVNMNYTVDDPSAPDVNTTIIDGIEEGISHLKEGDGATFIIPSDLAYGSAGTSSILPYAILIYEVKLTQVQK